MTNLLVSIQKTVENSANTTAIGFEGREQTYEEFWKRAGQFARALADAGVEPGDRIAIYLPNIPQFVVAFHGTLRAGGIVVPINPQYKSREIEHLLTDSGAVAVITLSSLVPVVTGVQDQTDVKTIVSVGNADGAIAFENFLSNKQLDIVERGDDDIACQPYTSGTTGLPKGVLLTHHNLAFEARASPEIHDGIYSDDKMLGVLPLFHIYGMTVTMLATLYEGGSFWLMREWDAGKALELIESVGITILHGVPTMYNDLVNHSNQDNFTLGTVRFANAGGSSLPLEVLRQFEASFKPELMEGYGLTETAPVTHANRPGDRRIGSIGKPIPGVEAMVVNEQFDEISPVKKGPIDNEVKLDDVVGEIVVSGPNVMKGYYNRPEANAEVFTYDKTGKQWFHTGDLGYRDVDNFYYIVDRNKHMIVTGGYNVYPREIEELLFEHQSVVDVAVVGVPDERRGETVAAFIVKHPDADITPAQIERYCLENLAEYKHPRIVHFVEELPRTATGKVQKFALEDFDY